MAFKKRKTPMNEIFDWQRFGKCLQSEITRAAAKYGIGLLVLGLLIPIVYVVGNLIALAFGMTVHRTDRIEYNFLPTEFVAAVATLSFVFGMPFALYGYITNPREGRAFILLPASTVEKFLAMIIVCLVVCPIVFFALMFGADRLLSVLDNHYNALNYNVFATVFSTSTGLSDPPDIGLAAVGYILIASFLLAGALWFKKHKLVFTILTMCGLDIVALFLVVCFFEAFMASPLFDRMADLETTVCEKDFYLVFAFLVALWELALLSFVYFRVKRIQH